MSNLLKGFCVAVDGTDKRVIDYNDIISEKLIEIKNAMSGEDFSEDGFSAGLNPVNVSQVLDDGGRVIGGELDEETVAKIEKENAAKREAILTEANAEADGIVARAREDASAIIDKAKLDAERIRAEARDSGYAEGMSAGSEAADSQYRQLVEELEQQRTELFNEYRRKEEKMEPALVDTILRIFAEITHAVSVDKRDMILTLVNNVMAGGEASRNFVIRVCNEDAYFLKENKEKIIGAIREDIHIEIVVDPSMKRNECLIDTDTGVYDCSLDIQLENLINDIRILSCTGE